MLTPRYLYRGDFSAFDELLHNQGARKQSFKAGELLWLPGEYIERTYYIERGIVKTSFVNDDGTEKTIFLHGAGMVFPGCHASKFTIELSLVSVALTPVTALEFSLDEMQQLLRTHPDLAVEMLESYARYINLLIFESAHQEHNGAMIKLCNLILLLARDSGEAGKVATRIDFSQEELAEFLGLNRVSVARLLAQLREEGAIVSHRGWTEIRNLDRLRAHCSGEAVG